MIELKKYVINLKRRDDRLKELRLPFDYTIFEATDGREVFSQYPIKQQGFMGCWDSHRRLFNKIKEENTEYTLIMEDDVDLVENFNERLNEVISELPNDWDLLYLGGWNVGDIVKYSSKLNHAKKVYTTHAFIVRQKYVDTIIKGINERQWKVDVLISDILPLGNCFICSPTLAWQREGFSDIENRETNNLHLK